MKRVNDKMVVYKVKEHYEIYIDDKFYCSCDINELRETINELLIDK